jgi:hypothetical protein
MVLNVKEDRLAEQNRLRNYVDVRMLAFPESHNRPSARPPAYGLRLVIKCGLFLGAKEG